MYIINYDIPALESQGKKPSELCKHLGVTNAVFSTWKKRGSDPSLKYIPGIAEFLGVSEHYLLTGEEEAAGYYIDPQVAEIANELKDRTDLRVLLDASRKLSSDDVFELLEKINRMKDGEN